MGMDGVADEELIAQAIGLTPIFVDGFGAFRKANGIFRTIGFCGGIAQINLIMSLVGAQDSHKRAGGVLHESGASNNAFDIWRSASAAH